MFLGGILKHYLGLFTVILFVFFNPLVNYPGVDLLFFWWPFDHYLQYLVRDPTELRSNPRYWCYFQVILLCGLFRYVWQCWNVVNHYFLSLLTEEELMTQTRQKLNPNSQVWGCRREKIHGGLWQSVCVCTCRGMWRCIGKTADHTGA